MDEKISRPFFVLRPATRRKVFVSEVAMADTNKCAHPACNCIVTKGGEYGKYCSEHCKQKGQSTELRCDCQHPACR
jgi:hypothetical protein